ncbi:MAG: hypothetical protein ACOC7K_01020 [bacterium]
MTRRTVVWVTAAEAPRGSFSSRTREGGGDAAFEGTSEFRFCFTGQPDLQ